MFFRSVALAVLVSAAAAAGIALGIGTLPGPQDEGATRFEARVRAYLMANPEVIFEAARLHQKREAEAQTERQRQLLARQGSKLRSSGVLPALGNSSGDVTLVEFFDYRCGYCKHAFGPLQALLRADGNIRMVPKELPLLGPQSLFAARAAIASSRQGKYAKYHDALMAHRGQFDERSVFAIAADLGLDVAKLRTEMAKPWVDKVIAETRQEARTLGISGTPAFIIGDTVVPGYMGFDQMKQLVAAARRRCVTC